MMPVNSIYIWNDNLQSFNREKMKHRYQSFTRIGRQFQSLERQVYADWTSVSFPFCQRSCLIWRIMTNTLTNTMTNTYVVIFLSVSIFGRGCRGYHSRYQNYFEFTEWCQLMLNDAECVLWYRMIPYDAEWCSMILDDARWCHMILNDVLWYRITLNDAIWCSLILEDITGCNMTSDDAT